MNDLIVNGKAQLPAHATSDEPSNLAGDLLGAAYPKLTFKGNRFRVRIGGEERVLGNTKLGVLILESNPHVSRIYFSAAYDGETATRPDCASEDGEVPLPSIKEPQGKSCSLCPMNEKGSAITDTGGKTRACSFYKRIVVLLMDEPALGPLVADMKAMSMFGRSYPDTGQFSLRDYAKRLADNKVAPYAVITELEFDTNESVPKVMFAAVDYTSKAFHDQHVAKLLEEGELDQMVRTDDMNTSSTDESADAGASGFRDKLMDGDAPDHAGDKAETKVETPAEPKVDPAQMIQEAVDGMKVDIKKAVADGDYAEAAAVQQQMEAFIAENQKAEPAKQEEKLSPQQKAARTRAANKAKKEADAKALAAEAEEKLNKEPDEQSDVTFDDDLEGALEEFGF